MLVSRYDWSGERQRKAIILRRVIHVALTFGTIGVIAALSSVWMTPL